jgi:hypothetical protein
MEAYMKNWLSIFTVLVVCFFVSCISMQARQLTPDERNENQVLGTVSTKWISLQFLHIPSSKKIWKIKHIRN